MTQKNRELSQFSSFLEVNNTNQNIGIATTGTPYIGIGTINPQYKLHLVGDTNIDGTIYVSGTPLVNAALQPWTLDGSNLYRENGSVGIGTSVYPSTFSVSGDATFSDEVTASQFISTVTTGTAPFTVTSQTEVTNLNASFLRGKTPPSGSIVGTSDIQTLTNKTLNLSSNTLTGTIAQFNSALSDDDFATIAGTQTLTNKTLTSPTITSIENSGAKTIPTGIGTFVITGSTGTVSSGMIADGTIVNTDISSSAAIDVSKLSSSTISGITLGSNLNNLTAGSYITYNSGSTYNGSTSKTIGVAGTTLNTANTLVARDASGDFSAGTISALNVNVDFSINSSDIKINDSVVIDNTKTLIGISSIGIGTDMPIRGIHIAGPDEYDIYLDARRSDVIERQLIFDNGNTYTYLYINKPGNIYGESFGWLDQSLSKYGSGSNRNIFFYRPPEGTLHVGESIIADIDNLKVGIGSTQPAHKLDVSGAVAAKSYVTAGISTTGNSTAWAVDASLTGHMYTEFDTDVECQIYNLFEGAEFKAFIKNTAGGTRDLTVVATDDTGPSFTAVRLSIPTAYNDNVNTIIINANDVRVMTVMNIKGNYVGFVN